MNRKKVVKVLLALLVGALIVWNAASGYRWAFSFPSRKDIRITRMEVWKPFAQIGNTPVTVNITEETQQQIIGLITAPTYHRELFYDGSSGDTFFMIYLEWQDDLGKTLQYSYFISNQGEVSIRDLNAGEEVRYVTNDNDPFIVSREETRGIYARIEELTGCSA